MLSTIGKYALQGLVIAPIIVFSFVTFTSTSCTMAAMKDALYINVLLLLVSAGVGSAVGLLVGIVKGVQGKE